MNCPFCQSKDVEKITELKGEVGFFKHVYQVDYKLDGKKDSTRVEAFDEFDAKRVVQRIEPKAIIIGAKKIGEGKNSKQGDKEKEQIKKLSEGLEKLVDELLSSKGYHPGKEYGWAYGKMINIYPKEIERIKTIIDQSRCFGPTTIKDNTIEFEEIQRESKLTEKGWFYKVVDRLKEDPEFNRLVKKYGANSDQVHQYVTKQEGEGTSKSIIDDLIRYATSDVKESKLTETVLELVGEIPELTKEDEQILRWAIRNNILFNEWPPNEILITGLQAKLPEEEKKKLETSEDIDLHSLYLRHILLPRAKKAWNEEVEKKAGVELESKDVGEKLVAKTDFDKVEVVELENKHWEVIAHDRATDGSYSFGIWDDKEEAYGKAKLLKGVMGIKESSMVEREDWDLTFQYTHNVIESNPILDKKGDPFIWQRSPIKGRKVRVFTKHQAEWAERQGAIPVKGEPWEPKQEELEIEDLPSLSNEEKSKVQEQDKDTYTTIAKGIVDKAEADRIARDKKGMVLTDEDDPKKFQVIVKEAVKYEPRVTRSRMIDIMYSSGYHLDSERKEDKFHILIFKKGEDTIEVKLALEEERE